MFLKSSRIIFWIIGAVVLALVFYIGKESFTQPGMERFEGKYEELGKYRNENNTGPVVRIFAVKALDPSENWMKEYGDAQPHTKYGKTIVFFFSEEIDQEIELSPKEPYIDQNLESYVLYTYEKAPMGEVRFKQGNSK